MNYTERYPDNHCYFSTNEIYNISIPKPLCLTRSVDDAKRWTRDIGKDVYALSSDFVVNFVIMENGSVDEHVKDLISIEKQIVVPTGFLTDMASVPKVGRAFVSRVGRYTEATVLHDWLYTYHKLHTKENIIYDEARAFSDLLFLEVMKYMGVSWYRRTMIYRTVRWFGWYAWRKEQKYYFTK